MHTVGVVERPRAELEQPHQAFHIVQPPAVPGEYVGADLRARAPRYEARVADIVGLRLLLAVRHLMVLLVERRQPPEDDGVGRAGEASAAACEAEQELVVERVDRPRARPNDE
eukprot:3048605-Prymnesium_polylepis.1